MRIWEVRDDWGVDHLRMVERDDPPPPGPGQISIRVRAATANYRDLVTISNTTPFGRLPQIPFSDAAGEVVAMGSGVSRVKLGDRVSPNFYPIWRDGPPTAANRAVALGSASAPGVLQDILVLGAESVSHCPAHLSMVEAATLPCAGLTAWRALTEEGRIKAGDTVLVQGTGGVSVFALQFAKMHGATVIATSSSDAKLERIRALGADHLINYRDNPEWGKIALELTAGRGVDHIVEVGGAGTINQSLAAAAVGGNILIIGVLGGRSQELLMPAIFGKNLRLQGISVGSRARHDEMSRAVERQGLKPVVDRVYPFAELPDLLHSMKANTHFGKLALDFTA